MGGSGSGRAGTGTLSPAAGATRVEPEPAVRVAMPRLMLVTDRHETRGRDLVDVVSDCVAGGVGLVQVRERDLPEIELLALIQRVLERLRGGPARVLVNGHPELARALGIGLHLPAAVAVPPVPAPPLWGRAVHDEAEARRAIAEGVSYAVVGPVFPTASKPGHPGAGLPHLARLVRLLAPTPVFAIGGLRPARVPEVLAGGAHGVAVRSVLLSAEQPERVARTFVRALG